MRYLDLLEEKVLLERLVIGLEEPVLIKGLGELSAKIDSGNGGYNVIHGTDFHQQGDELMFTTHDSFGHDKKIQAKVIDTIEINMGGGNVESRPVIELDIKFAGEDYKKIPFSVSDRSSNTNPILISKGFVENELEALIDVGAMNISHEGRDVVYGEGAWDTVKAGLKGAGKGVLKGAANTGKGLLNIGKNALDGAKGILGGIKNADKWLKGGNDVNLFQPVVPGVKNLAKVGAGVFALNNILSLSASAIGLYALWHGAKGALQFKRTQNMASNIAKGNTIITDDYNKISKQLPGLTLQNTLVKDRQIDLSTNIIKQWSEKSIDPTNMPISLVTSFMMTKGNIEDQKTIKGLEVEKEAWKDLIASAKETTKVMKDEKAANNQQQTQGQQQTQEQEEFTESIMIFEDAQTNLATPTAPITPTTPSTTPDATSSETTTPEGTATTGGEEDTKKAVMEQGEQKAKEIKEITTQFEQLNTFTLWFISFENDKKKKEQIESQIKKLTQSLESLEKEQNEKPTDSTEEQTVNDTTSSDNEVASEGEATPEVASEIDNNEENNSEEATPEVENNGEAAPEVENNGENDGESPEDADSSEKTQNKKDNIEPLPESVDPTQANNKVDNNQIKVSQSIEKLKQQIESYKKQLNNIGLPNKGQFESDMKKYIENASIDDKLKSLFKSGNVDSNTAAPIVKALASSFQKENKQGFFCLAWTPQSQSELKDDLKEVKREYYFFETPEYIAYAKSNTTSEVVDSSSEDEEWVNSKLNYFKSKGII